MAHAIIFCMTTFCTRDIAPTYFDDTHVSYLGRHFIIEGNKIKSARYCYSWQKCARARAPFSRFIQDMANDEWKHGNYAGLSYEEILLKMFNGVTDATT